MGWNLHLTLVRGRTTGDLAALGMFRLADDPVTVGEATELRSPAVAQAGEDLLFVDGGMVALEFNTVLAARLQAEVVTGIFSSVSDTYVWSVLQPDGSHRSVAVAQGERSEEGAALPEEDGLDVLDEDALFTLLQRRTGLGDDWFDLPAYALVG
jgi:hypothetical protein